MKMMVITIIMLIMIKLLLMMTTTMIMMVMMLLQPRRTLDSYGRLSKNRIAQALQRELATDGCQSTAKGCSESHGKLWYIMWFDYAALPLKS